MIIRILMFPIALLLVLYFVIAQVVPTYRAIAAEKATITQKQKALTAVEKKKNEVDTFIRDVKAHSAEQDFVSSFVPNDQQEEVLINDVSQIAEKSGVELFSIGFSEGRSDVRSAAAGGGAHLIEGRMIVSGTYESFITFLNQMFHIDRLYAFKTIDLVKVEVDDLEEGQVQGPQILNGTVSFAYGYIPGQAIADPTAFNQGIDYKLINTVMNSIAQTDPLVSEPRHRTNPFLP